MAFPIPYGDHKKYSSTHLVTSSLVNSPTKRFTVSVPSNDTQLVADGVSEQDKAGPRQLIRINKSLDQVKINVTTVNNSCCSLY